MRVDEMVVGNVGDIGESQDNVAISMFSCLSFPETHTHTHGH